MKYSEKDVQTLKQRKLKVVSALLGFTSYRNCEEVKILLIREIITCEKVNKVSSNSSDKKLIPPDQEIKRRLENKEFKYPLIVKVRTVKTKEKK